MRKVFEVDGIHYESPAIAHGSVYRREIFEYLEEEPSLIVEGRGIITARLKEEGPHQEAAEHFMTTNLSVFGYDYDEEQ